MGCDHNCESCSKKDNCNENDLRVKTNNYSFIDKIVGVVSGKGGVGKSLVTALIAKELNKKGYNVAILDADITGPSIPKMFGLTGKASSTEIGIMPMLTKSNIKVMSTNLLLDKDDQPVIWRGPIIASMVSQFYTDVVWDKVDVMLVDMPPGTGDVPLTVFQSLPVDSIVVVTSPQELVSMIVGKAVNMANLMNIPIIGVVENMSYFHCPDNGKDYKIFGDSHLEETCDKYDLDVLGNIPIDPLIASLADKGEIENLNDLYLEKLVEKIEELPIKEKN